MASGGMAKRTRINLPEGNPKSKMPHQILDSILSESLLRAAALREHRDAFEQAIAVLSPPRSFAGVLRRSDVAIIAEVKKRSPSLGSINEMVDPVALAGAYETGGAAAISVLTEERHFSGSIEDLRTIARAARAPVLRKDFIVDAVQLLEARAAGAAAVLLIVRALTPVALASLIDAAKRLQLEVLVEAHSAQEIAIALDAGARIVGVNARDLDTLAIDSDRAWRLLSAIPSDVVAVAESGMRDAADVARAAAHGADAVLIGSALVASGAPTEAVRSLRGVKRRGR